MFNYVVIISLCLAFAASFFYNPENNCCTRLRDYPVKAFSKHCRRNPYVMSDTSKMIVESGHNVKSYFVTTPDGYSLQLFRAYSKTANNNRKQPIFLLHGVAANSGQWLANGNKSIGYALLEAGYDVWLGNQRDTWYSTINSTLSQADYRYWNYTLDTLVSNDIKTFLEFIAQETQEEESIIYIGHSRGSALALMFAAEFPQLAKEVLKGIITLSPTFMFDPVFYIRILAEAAPLIQKLMAAFHITVFFRYTPQFRRTVYVICSMFPFFCNFVLVLSSGNKRYLPPNMLLPMFSDAPFSVPALNLMHWTQQYKSGKVQKFDFGVTENRIRYGQDQPPIYNLSNVNVPVVLFYGKRDIFMSEKSVKKLFETLTVESKFMASVPFGLKDHDEQFGHNDWFWTENLKELFTDRFLKILSNMSQINF